MPDTKVLEKMLDEVKAEIDYMNSCITPTLVKRFGAGTFKTGMIIKCAEMPTLIDAPRFETGAVKMMYKDCVRFSGQRMGIDRAKFLKRYYATEEGKKYKEFLDGLTDPHERERYKIL